MLDLLVFTQLGSGDKRFEATPQNPVALATQDLSPTQAPLTTHLLEVCLLHTSFFFQAFLIN